EDGLRRRRPAVETDDRAHDLPGFELRLLELRDLVELAEVVGFGHRANEGRTRRVAEALFATVRDVALESFDSREKTGVIRFGEPINRRAERGVVLRALRHEDELFDGDVLRVVVTAFLPDLRDAQPPALLQERQVRVRPAEKK